MSKKNFRKFNKFGWVPTLTFNRRLDPSGKWLRAVYCVYNTYTSPESTHTNPLTTTRTPEVQLGSICVF